MNTRNAFALILAALAGLGIASTEVSAKSPKFQMPIVKTPIAKAPVSSPSTPVFRIQIDRVVINDTRSLHEDSDILAASVSGQPNQIKVMGDVNNGNYPQNLFFDVAVAASDKVSFSYAILNTAINPGTVATYLGNGAAGVGTLFGSDWSGLLAGGCDGMVAEGAHDFTGAALAAQTAGGKKISSNDYTPGTDSPHGCGSNSRYYVYWSVSAK
jgi:hypothetical protein